MKVDPGLVADIFTKINIYILRFIAYNTYKSISSFETWPELKTKTFFSVLARSLLHYGSPIPGSVRPLSARIIIYLVYAGLRFGSKISFNL